MEIIDICANIMIVLLTIIFLAITVFLIIILCKFFKDIFN